MVTPYRQIHEANKALMPLDIQQELAPEDLSIWINPDGGLTGAAQEHLAEQDLNGDFI